jgi:hypothetical protein
MQEKLLALASFGGVLAVIFLVLGALALLVFYLFPIKMTHALMRMSDAAPLKGLVLTGCAWRKVSRRLTPELVALGFLTEIHHSEVALRLARIYGAEVHPGHRRKFATFVAYRLTAYLVENTWNDTASGLHVLFEGLRNANFPLKEELEYLELLKLEHRNMAPIRNANPIKNPYLEERGPEVKVAFERFLRKRERTAASGRTIAKGIMRTVDPSGSPVSRKG